MTDSMTVPHFEAHVPTSLVDKNMLIRMIHVFIQYTV